MATRLVRKKTTSPPQPEVVDAPLPPPPPSTLRRLLPAMFFVAVLLAMVVGFYNTDTKDAAQNGRKQEKTRVEQSTRRAPQKGAQAAMHQKSKAQYDKAKATFISWQKSPYGADRDDWLQLSHDFYKIYEEFTQWPNRPAALMRAAEVMQYMAKEEKSQEDYLIAVELYEKLAKEFPQSILADDALYAAAWILAHPLKKQQKALKLLAEARSTYKDGDMLARVMLLEKSLMPKQKVQEKAKEVSKQEKTQAKPAPQQKSSQAQAEKKKPATPQEKGQSQSKPVYVRPTPASLPTLVAKYSIAPWQVPETFHISEGYTLSGQSAPVFVPSAAALALEAKLEQAKLEQAKLELAKLQQEQLQKEALQKEKALLLAQAAKAAEDSAAQKAAAQKATAQQENKEKVQNIPPASQSTTPLAGQPSVEPKAAPAQELLLAEKKEAPVMQHGEPKALPHLVAMPTTSTQTVAVPKPQRVPERELPAAIMQSPPPVAPAPQEPSTPQGQGVEDDATYTAQQEKNPAQPHDGQGQVPQEIRRRLAFITDLVPDLEPVFLGMPSFSGTFTQQEAVEGSLQEPSKGATLKQEATESVPQARKDEALHPLLAHAMKPAHTPTAVGSQQGSQPATGVTSASTPLAAVDQSSAMQAPLESPAVSVASIGTPSFALTPEPKLEADDLANRMQNAKKTDFAAQLGLSIRTVFVDIGHGGRDPGTMHNGLVERDVVLDIGKRVGELLQSHGFTVIYSRTNNVTVPLSVRPVRANEVGADLFVSIHMNAFTDTTVQGFETYYLDFTKNSDASRVATLENSVSDKSLGDLQDVLANMLLNVRTQESSGLAKAIQRSTMQELRKQSFSTRDGGTRSAPFHVLIGTAMPAVLVEVGYCTHKKDAAFLKRSDYRTALAQGIVQGILRYKESLQQKVSAHFTLTQNTASGR